VILSSSGSIMPEDLPDEFSQQPAGPVGNREIDLDELLPPGVGLNESLEAIEKKLIERALSRTDYVQSHAAELLGIKKNVMQYKMKKHGLL
jgi:two-component system, NtrC family, response regulator